MKHSPAARSLVRLACQRVAGGTGCKGNLSAPHPLSRQRGVGCWHRALNLPSRAPAGPTAGQGPGSKLDPEPWLGWSRSAAPLGISRSRLTPPTLRLWVSQMRTEQMWTHSQRTTNVQQIQTEDTGQRQESDRTSINRNCRVSWE